MMEHPHDDLGAVQALQFLLELRQQGRRQHLAVEDHSDILDHRSRPAHLDAALLSVMPNSPIGHKCLVSRRRTRPRGAHHPGETSGSRDIDIRRSLRSWMYGLLPRRSVRMPYVQAREFRVSAGDSVADRARALSQLAFGME
jgi:hypothetical protein